MPQSVGLAREQKGYWELQPFPECFGPLLVAQATVAHSSQGQWLACCCACEIYLRRRICSPSNFRVSPEFLNNLLTERFSTMSESPIFDALVGT